MKTEIDKVCIIGSGIMGSSIAALIADAGIEVILLDIPSKNGENRNEISKLAIKRLEENHKKYFTKRNSITNISIGNIEDDMSKIKDCKLIIEVIIENLDKKIELYKKIKKYQSKHAIVASNTSTIQIKDLCKGMNSELKKNFFILHFFNPPKSLALLELIENKESSIFSKTLIKEFLSNQLNRHIVRCKDTPGFIGNRIGCFFICIAIKESIEMGNCFNETDQILNKVFGIPKSGAFGLIDIIGLDVFKFIINSFVQNLPKKDSLLDNLDHLHLIESMIDNNHLGKKVGKGFYSQEGDKKLILKSDLNGYKEVVSLDLDNIEIDNICMQNDKLCQSALYIIASTINYITSIMDEISYSIEDIETVMKVGYGWKYGPFELIDKFKTKEKAGINILSEYILSECTIKMSNFISLNQDKNMYYEDKIITFNGSYINSLNQKKWMVELSEIISKKDFKDSALINSEYSELITVCPGIICFNLKKSVINIEVIEALSEALDILNKKKYSGLIITSFNDNFCFGADLKYIKKCSKQKDYKSIKQLILRGNEVFERIKDSEIPIVCVTSGYVLGGGCELMMHCPIVISSYDSKIGLSESNVGLIPGWGGIKEMICRIPKSYFGKMIENIINGKTSNNAHGAREMHYLTIENKITQTKAQAFQDAINTIRKLENLGFEKCEKIEFKKNIESLTDINKKLINSNLNDKNKNIAESIHAILTNLKNFEELQSQAFLKLLKRPDTEERINKVLNSK